MLYILDMVITIKAVMSDVPVPAHLLYVVTKPLFPGQNEDTGHSNASAVVGIVVDVKVAFFTQSLPVDEKIIDDVMHVIEVVDSITFDLFVIHDDNIIVKSPSNMKRHAPGDRDGGVFACEVNGFAPDEDEALGSYTHFKAFTPEEQTRAILLLSYRFLKAEPEEVVDDE